MKTRQIRLNKKRLLSTHLVTRWYRPP